MPKINMKLVTRALLHTSEFNRNLSRGVKHWGRHYKNKLASYTTSSKQQQQQQQQQQQILPSNFGNHQNQQQQQQHEQLYNHQQQHHHQTFDAHGYGNIPVNVHPSRTWQPPIEAFSGRDLEEEELTLFHAKIPRTRAESTEIEIDTESETESETETETESGETTEEIPLEDHEDRGADYWGPDLLPYLEHIAEILHMDGIDNGSDDSNDNSNDKSSTGVELLLAMIYLDRACSVETPRSNGVPPCPFCGPRTVHRLGLAALVVAKRAMNVNVNVNSSSNPSSAYEYGERERDEERMLSKLSTSLGIPNLQLQQMVEWMVGALGDDGLYVGLEDMRTWSRIWESFVSSNSDDEQQEL